MNRKLLPIFFLGFSGGVPLALIATVLSTWLTELGTTKTSIGLFTLVTIPYSFKYLWSPFVDGLHIPILDKLGKRRSWLLATQIFVMCAIFFMGSINPLTNMTLCAILAIAVAFFSATQDIVIDAYRIEHLEVHDQGLGAAVYSYGYRIALYISGALPLIVATYFTWQAAYISAGLLIMIGVITTLVIEEPHKHKKKTQYKNALEFLNKIIVAPFKNFIKIPSWYIIIIFVILFKLGDAMAGIMTTPFLLDIGFSKIEIVSIVKTYGLVTTFIGLFIGGLMVSKFTFKESLLYSGLAQMLSNLMFVYQDYVGYDSIALISTITVENLASGMGATVMIAYLSSLCSLKFAATQYALLSSIVTLSRNVISGFSGIIVDNYNWTTFFLVSTIAALPALLLISKIQVFDKHRQ
ncbi:MAG: AmpG family muropeptide MFS transporter [Alphaproteobacteria bacterium]|nr:AmpG family muropeptide MFS transporter [Alphaproteobacteria bacterium]